MIFVPSYSENREGKFVLSSDVEAVGSHSLCADVFAEMWHNFSYTFSSMTLKTCSGHIFRIGDVELPTLSGEDFVISVEQGGIAIVAKSDLNLRCAFFTLLDMMKIDEDDGLVSIDCCFIRDTSKISVRMVHFCVFPETELWELRRFIRFCASLRFTHVIVEFWGMIKLDAMRELAWSFAYTKEEIAPIIAEANELGIKMIPMFNHWGHAAGSRVRHGKHVVLDQNPSLQSYFSDDGWCWRFEKPKVKLLLSKIRDELFEMFEGCEYFHAGCDEAYGFDLSKTESCDKITDYLNEINESVRRKGKRLIVWGDMFVYKDPDFNSNNKYECNCPSKEAQGYLLSRLDRDIIIADWQYSCEHAPLETSEILKNAGFDVMICPWDRTLENVAACTETVKRDELFGLIHTTWHTLSSGAPMVTASAVYCYGDLLKFSCGNRYTSTAALLRKVYPAMGDYKKSGWSKKQIDDITK